MAGIIGLLDILLADELTVEQELNLFQIKQCATSLLGLLNDVLDLEKVRDLRRLVFLGESKCDRLLSYCLCLSCVFCSLDVHTSVRKHLICETMTVHFR